MPKQCKQSSYKSGTVCNTATGRWVKKTGKIGKQILAQQNRRSTPRRSTPRRRSSPPPGPCKRSSYKSGKICNPSTKRWVNKSGKIGKQLLAQQNRRSTPRRSTPRRSSPRSPQRSPLPFEPPPQFSPSPVRRSPVRRRSPPRIRGLPSPIRRRSPLSPIADQYFAEVMDLDEYKYQTKGRRSKRRSRRRKSPSPMRRSPSPDDGKLRKRKPKRRKKRRSRKAIGDIESSSRSRPSRKISISKYAAFLY